jgi:hypothetical protein
MGIEEVVDKFEYCDRRFVPGDNAEKTCEHFTESLNEQLRLVGNEGVQ